MSLNKVWLSFVDYRPDPAEPDRDRIALGCILEAGLRGGREREIVLTGRVELTESELGRMDGIGREMLGQPSAFLNQEFRRFLDEHSEPVPFEKGGVLAAFTRKHRWSLHVTPPRLVRIERHLSQTNREALVTVCDDLLIARALGKEVPLTMPLRAKRIVSDDWRAQVPPAWQIAHSSWVAPGHSRAQF
jgi:hypothetical protein